MNTTMIAMGISLIAAIGMVVGLGALSLLSGAIHFLFGKPKLDILKSENGPGGLAFSFRWNSAREPVKFDRIKIRLFNPFGRPTQVDVSREFAAESGDFAQDFDMGPGLAEIINAKGLDNSLVEIEVSSLTGGVTHYFEMKARTFLEKRMGARQTAQEFNAKYKRQAQKPVFHVPARSFVAAPLLASNKSLKLATNPEFAGQFAGDAGAEVTKENFAVSKVWIEPGCIVCNACEAIYAQVFEVTVDSCIIRPNAPLENGLLIEEAAEACPVEVIKFTKIA